MKHTSKIKLNPIDLEREDLVMDIFDKVKGWSARGGFEADRLVRLNRIKSEIQDLRRNMGAFLTQLGESVYQLQRTEQINLTQCTEIFQQIEMLESKLKQKEAEISAIRNEIPPQPYPGYPAGVVPVRFCPKCQAGTYPLDIAFCPECGIPTQVVPPPLPPAQHQPGQWVNGQWVVQPSPSGQIGPTTGSSPFAPPQSGGFTNNPGQQYNSGQQFSPYAPNGPVAYSAAVPAERSCAKCGTVLLPEAIFCPECGMRLTNG